MNAVLRAGICNNAWGAGWLTCTVGRLSLSLPPPSQDRRHVERMCIPDYFGLVMPLAAGVYPQFSAAQGKLARNTREVELD